MIKIKDLQAIYFDMGGVLMYLDSRFNRNEAIRYAFDIPELHSFLGYRFDLVELNSKMMELYEKKYFQPGDTDQPDAWVEIYQLMTEFFGKELPFNIYHKLFWRYPEYMTQYFRLKPNVHYTLEKLKKMDLKIGLISNVFHSSIIYRQLFLKWKIIEYFNPIVFSSDLRYKKPDHRIFKYALDFHPELVPERTLYVGDTYDVDIVGASGVGMNPIWVNIRNEVRKESAVPEIQCISELVDMVN